MSALLILGVVLILVGAIWQLVVTFKTSIGWGIASLIIPFVSLIFVGTHWQISKNAFICQVIGIVLVVVVAMSSPELMAEYSRLE